MGQTMYGVWLLLQAGALSLRAGVGCFGASVLVSGGEGRALLVQFATADQGLVAGQDGARVEAGKGVHWPLDERIGGEGCRRIKSIAPRAERQVTLISASFQKVG